VYPDFRLWLVEAEGRAAAAALRTLPYNVIVADARDDAAIEALVAAVAADDRDAPGAVGNVPTIGRFTETWARAAAIEVRLAMAQGVFAIERVRPVPTPRGASRPVAAADRDLLVAWFEAFTAEALPDEPNDRERLLAYLDRRIAGGPGGGIWLWQRGGEPVAMCGYGGPTPHGIRIGPVYTPPEHRGNGYATALVAAQSAWLLQTGRRFCFLYTDLANPTSNAIYKRIGYEQVGESAAYAFRASPAQPTEISRPYRSDVTGASRRGPASPPGSERRR
jgi:uncharacterized protein